MGSDTESVIMAFENCRVLVTGGAGVIGQELIERLISAGAHVICMDIKPRPLSFPKSVEYVQTDLSTTSPEDIASHNPEILFHLAATFERTTETPEFSDDNFKNNVQLSHVMLKAAGQAKTLKKFIFTSSYLVYAPEQYLFTEPTTKPTIISETNPIHPRNLIGAAKYYTENEIEYQNRISDHFSIISARIFRVYGKGSKDIISRWIRAALKGEELYVYNKENSFDYIYAGDVAEGLFRMAATVHTNTIFNLGYGSTRRVEEILGILKDRFPDITIHDDGYKGLYENSCAGIERLTALTRWKPEISLEQGIQKIIDYETSH
jgi:nucleoside-diphosphate-sugar epimerase